MHQANQSSVMYFIIKGISEVPQMLSFIFLLVLLIYLMTLGGNFAVLFLVCADCHLHTPMYFFLCNLSLVDIFSTTVTLHKMLLIFITGDNTVSFTACMAQMCLFSWLSGNTLIILTVMSFDRFMAICNPLRYHMIMKPVLCILLVLFCWSFSLLQVIPPVIILSRLSCYINNEINHFFCDIIPLLNISCSDTYILKLLIFTEGVLLSTLTPFLLTFISYVCIIISILKISSSFGRLKAFYTCSSHLTVVMLLYAMLVFQYLIPTNSLESHKFFSLLNTVAVPMLNPLIYSLKNKDVMSALRRRLLFYKMANETFSLQA
ncbi:olfactory receptor 1019 [Xenopus laevis]|uniref:Olfactory receptor 1019 n=2 Tax=Xenopus laevis TaxID=8355 RepID=A0A1L8F3G7_XENLA|nr:olfactory receptor 1019 [Xenopus laevis]OCT66142.1 hypothetical protein XELAEV_18042397mg [Xenopus laevis]